MLLQSSMQWATFSHFRETTLKKKINLIKLKQSHSSFQGTGAFSLLLLTLLPNDVDQFPLLQLLPWLAWLHSKSWINSQICKKIIFFLWSGVAETFLQAEGIASEVRGVPGNTDGILRRDGFFPSSRTGLRKLSPVFQKAKGKVNPKVWLLLSKRPSIKKSGLVEGAPARGSGIRTMWSIRFLPTQTVLWFCDWFYDWFRDSLILWSQPIDPQPSSLTSCHPWVWIQKWRCTFLGVTSGSTVCPWTSKQLEVKLPEWCRSHLPPCSQDSIAWISWNLAETLKNNLFPLNFIFWF